MNLRVFASAAAAATLCLSGAAMANDSHVEVVRNLALTHVKPWLTKPEIINALNARNAETGNLGQAEIDKLDKEWRAATQGGDQKLIKSIVSNSISDFLRARKAEAKGVVAEIILMDAKGLNVGVSDVTSDYWQGDEAKWQKTFLVGPDAVFVDDIEMDASSQALSSQVSFSITDPATNTVIGAVTVTINVEQL